MLALKRNKGENYFIYSVSLSRTFDGITMT